jgi:hypothetical protein
MPASTFRDFALPYVGISSVGMLPANASARLIQCFNQALQEIFRDEHQETLGAQIHAPTPVVIGQVTQGSTAITFTGFQAWMLGCTIHVSGDSIANALEKKTSSVSLRHPYQGSTQANVTATVYHDALTFDTELKQVYPPVKLNDQYYVEPLPDRATLDMSRTVWRDEYSATPKTARRPQWYTLEDALAYNTTPATRLLFDSLPDTSYILSLQARLRAPRIIDWTDTRDYFIPGQEDESILYPWALGKFLSWPQFLSDSNIRAQVAADAATASSLWQSRSKGFVHTAVSMD